MPKIAVNKPQGSDAGGRGKLSSTFFHYGFVLILVALATIIRLLLDPFLGEAIAAYLTYFLANVVIIRFTSIGPSIFAILLGAVAVDFFFLPPIHTLGLNPVQILTTGIFIVANLLILGLAQSMRRAQERSQANEQRLKLAEKAAKAGNFVWYPATGKGSWSDELWPLFGLPLHSCEPTYEAWRECIIPEDREKAVQTVQAGATAGAEINAEWRVRDPSGQERWLWGIGQPQRNAAGEVSHYLGYIFDITQRKRTELALRQSEKKYRDLVETTMEGVWSVDVNGIITFVNSRMLEMLKYSDSKELLGSSVFKCFPAEDRERLRERLSERLKTNFKGYYELRLLCRDGEILWGVIADNNVYDDHGNTVGRRGFVMDITERKKAEQALVAAKEQLRLHNENLEKIVQERTAKLNETVQELDHFSYAIIHDLRAPLRAMTGFANILLSQSANRMTAQEIDLLERIVTAAYRMDMLIRDALQYNKAVREEIVLKPVSPSALLRGMLQSYPQLQPPVAEISIQPDMPRVMGNEAALTQCFSNLLSNAVQYVKPGAKASVRIWAQTGTERSEASADGKSVRIWVEDNGVGIAKEHIEQIWTMFGRLDEDGRGTGMGLALVRKLVQRMKGQAGVESEPGCGSRFWIELRAPKNGPQV